MKIRNIFVYLPSYTGAEKVLSVAKNLAKKHHAKLIGLHIVPVIFAASVPRYPIPNDILDAEQQRRKVQADTLAKLFQDATKEMHDDAEWILVENQTGSLAEHVLEYASTADVIVVPRQEDYPLNPVADIGSELTMTSGRPVIIVPIKHKIESVGTNVLFAWKPVREATRALFDSIPIMQKANSVCVATVDEGESVEVELKALSSALTDHGVEASIKNITGEKAGPGLLSEMKNGNYDLLVMGCYGRSRFSEIIFGGATRHMLSKMDIPVLMSH